MWWLTLISTLKGSKDLLATISSWCKSLLCFIWKNKMIAVIVLLMYIVTSQKNDISDLKVEVSVEQGKQTILQQKHTNDILTLVNQSKQLELDRLVREQQIEAKHNEQIHKMLRDNDTLDNTYRSLSDTLTKAANRLQQHSVDPTHYDQVKAYGSTVTELFGECTTEYRDMAKKAQQHRVAEEVAVHKYNNIVE